MPSKILYYQVETQMKRELCVYGISLCEFCVDSEGSSVNSRQIYTLSKTAVAFFTHVPSNKVFLRQATSLIGNIDMKTRVIGRSKEGSAPMP